jgi:hypothetical protein
MVSIGDLLELSTKDVPILIPVAVKKHHGSGIPCISHVPEHGHEGGDPDASGWKSGQR